MMKANQCTALMAALSIGLAAGTRPARAAGAAAAAPTDSALAGIAAITSEARFQVDRAASLKQFDTVFVRPIDKGYNAVAVGNGDLAAITWQPGDMTWMLNKCDLSGDASQAARLSFETPDKLADRLGRLETRLSAADATVKISYRGGEFGDSKGWGWRGRNSGAADPKDVDLGTMDTTAIIPNGRNCLLINYSDKPKVPHATTIVFERWLQPSWGNNAEARVQGDTLAITYHLRSGLSYAAVLAHDGFAGAGLAADGKLKTTLTLPAAEAISGRLAIAVVTSAEAADPLAAATSLAKSTLAANEAGLQAANRAWWLNFWEHSYVDSGHPYVNALYHAALYELGITSRGRRPVKFNGALNLWNENGRVWGSPYWCHNQSEVYLPLYTANHIDLADNFHDWIARVRPEAVKAGRQSFGVEGAYYPEVMDDDFAVKDPDKSMHPPLSDAMAYILSSGTRYALMMWNRYQYTLDRPFLETKAYPVMRDVAQFYVNYGKLGADGLYHVDPTRSWEETPIGRDAHADCAAWRAIFSSAIEAATELGIDKDKVALWKDRLAKAPPYPSEGGRFSVVMREDGTPEPTNHFQWQLPNLSGVFPYSVIGLESPVQLRSTADATFDAYRYNADAGHEFLPVIAARLGRPDWFRAALFQYVQYFQSFDQGLFNYYNAEGNKELGNSSEADLHPYLEASGNFSTAVNESLLQSYDGRIRVFPALPERWQGRFVLRAAGSFLVCSEKRATGASGISYILVEPIAGEARTCRVVVPWPGGASIAGGGKAVQFAMAGDSAEFVARPGTVYALTPRGTKLGDVPLVKVDTSEVDSPSRIGNVWYGNREGQNNHTSSFPLW